MYKLVKIIILIMSFSIVISTNANAQFGGLLKKQGGADVGALANQQAGIVQTLVAGFTEYTAGQAQIARALGLKEEVDKLESEQDALSSGNVNDKDGIERTMKISASAQEAIDKKMEEGAVLSAESKAEFSKALPFYARGTANTISLIPELTKWGTSATSAIKGGGMMGAMKIKKTLGTGMFVVSKLPGYLKNAKKSYGSLIAFSKKNEIDTSEAETLLGDDI